MKKVKSKITPLGEAVYTEFCKLSVRDKDRVLLAMASDLAREVSNPHAILLSWKKPHVDLVVAIAWGTSGCELHSWCLHTRSLNRRFETDGSFNPATDGLPVGGQENLRGHTA